MWNKSEAAFWLVEILEHLLDGCPDQDNLPNPLAHLFRPLPDPTDEQPSFLSARGPRRGPNDRRAEWQEISYDAYA